jgi:hypothetical protein
MNGEHFAFAEKDVAWQGNIAQAAPVVRRPPCPIHYNLTGLPHAPRSGGEPKVDRRDPPCAGAAVRQLRGDRVRGGQVVGRGDAQGAMPADNPVHVSDFVATICQALGYGAETRVTDPLGRPHYIVQGKSVRELF